MRTLLVALVLAVLAGCGSKPSKFSVADVVEVTQTEESVTVLRKYGTATRGWRYECRVTSPVVVTHDGLVSRDSVVSRYAVIWFWEFELREVDE